MAEATDNKTAAKASDAQPAADGAKKKAAPSLIYGDHTTLAKPKAVDHLPTPVRGGGDHGGGGAPDIVNAFKEIEPFRGKWFQVAETIPNPGRFYDGFRARGAQVKVNRVGVTKAHTRDGKEVEVPTFDVYAMVPEGPIKPWKKGTKKAEAQAKLAENAAAATEAPAGKK